MKWAAGTMCTIQVDDLHGYPIFGLSMFLVYVNMVKFVFGPPFIFIVFDPHKFENGPLHQLVAM